MEELKNKVRQFVVDNYLFGEDEGLKEDTSFIDEGIIDSLGILELVHFLTDEFSITIEDDELMPENLDSIVNVARFMQKKVGDSVLVN